MKFHGTKIDERAQSLSIDLGSRSLLSHFAALIHEIAITFRLSSVGIERREITRGTSVLLLQIPSTSSSPSIKGHRRVWIRRSTSFLFFYFFFSPRFSLSKDSHAFVRSKRDGDARIVPIGSFATTRIATEPKPQLAQNVSCTVKRAVDCVHTFFFHFFSFSFFDNLLYALA